MKLGEIASKLGLKNLTPELDLDGRGEVAGGYVSDLLSDALAHAPKGGVLVTIQVHSNAIAVAVHAGLTGVIFASGREPDEKARLKAVEEGVALLVSNRCAFDLVGMLYGMGLRGPCA